MSTVDYFIGGGTTSSAGTTRYTLLAMGVTAGLSSETNSSVPFHTTTTFSNLRCYIVGNAATSTSYINFRKNLAAGNQSVSIAAGATGEFIDSVNTDSVTAGDASCLQKIIGTVS